MADGGAGNEVLFEVVDGHIAVVTLNRPEVRNAVNGAVAIGLDAAVKRVEGDPELRVAILASSRNKVFCAGADLAEIAAGRAHLLSTKDGAFAGFVEHSKTKPWIAAVEAAFAGGCEIVLACDMIAASEAAKFGLPEVKRGLYAGAAGVYRLPRRLPRNIGVELVVTGEGLDAARAYTLGLVNRLTAPGGALAAALDLARSIAANAPLSVRESLAIARLYHDLTEDELRSLSRAATPVCFPATTRRKGRVPFSRRGRRCGRARRRFCRPSRRALVDASAALMSGL